ncbi:hypothetical protein BH09ACT8_BH09ACT8_05130 [soil metagenome]
MLTEIAARRRSQPAPPWAVFEDLCDPHRQPARPWLELADDEVPPTVIEALRPTRVDWSSLWPSRPDVRLRFELSASGGESMLRWGLWVDDPVPDADLVVHLRRRIDQLVNANLRYTYGQ